MIRLTRLNRRPIALNADLIKWIESSPDTVITLANGEKLVVLDSLEQVMEAVLSFRCALAEAGRCDYCIVAPTNAQSE